MIIGQDVLRLLTIKALRGRTWVQLRVFDSPAQAADLRLVDDRQPFIGVYTDDADLDCSDGNSLSNPDNTVFLLIEIAAADQVGLQPNVAGEDQDPSDPDVDQAPAPPVPITLAATDEALELVIGLISRQVCQALLATDNPWAELWRMLAVQRGKIEIRRGGTGQQEQQPAIRFASRIMRMHLTVVADPVTSEQLPADGFWAQFLAAADADEELAGAAALIRQHITTEPGRPTWRVEQSRMTLTQQALVAIGISPLPQVIPDEAEPDTLTEVTAHSDDGGQDMVLAPEPPEGP